MQRFKETKEWHLDKAVSLLAFGDISEDGLLVYELRGKWIRREMMFFIFT
jgi:hypothetical protein